MTTSETTTPSSSLSPEEEATQAREKIDNDLKTWQEKFTKAAERGTEDLKERVNEITERQVANQAQGVGKALVIQLEESSSSELSGLKKKIIKIVQSLPQQPGNEDFEKAEKELAGVIRSAGLVVKAKAQSLRSWKQEYDRETRSLVNAASESTLQVVDNIRDLGLQEIGMRWAWMEGVTFKDWSRYHSLKETFDEWRSEIDAIAAGHLGLTKANDAGDDVESRGMTVAEAVAKELGRLKEVGKWKIHAQDSSDDFSTKYVPAGAASVLSGATQNIKDATSRVSSNLMGTEAGVVEQAATKISEAMSGTQQPAHESVASMATSQLRKGANKASGAVMGTEQPVGESLASVASSKASQAASAVSDDADSFTMKFVDNAGKGSSKASEALLGTSTPLHESIASELSTSGAAAASAVSEALVGSSTPVAASISSVTSSVNSAAASAASKASKKVWGGAMAQKVKVQTPILDDTVEDNEDASYSEKLQSMVSEAGDRYADVTRAVSEALLKPSSTQGSVESITSVASDQYASAIAAASSALYGTQQGTGKSIASVASGRYADAVSA